MDGATHEMVCITREDLRAEVQAAVQRAFADVGIYADTPDERREIRADLYYLRRWRETVDGAAIQVGRVVLLAVAGGLIAALWLGIKLHVLKQP